jgi:hypothetical protein
LPRRVFRPAEHRSGRAYLHRHRAVIRTARPNVWCSGALIADCFTPRLRYRGCSIVGYQLASVIAGGSAPLIATALLAATGSGYAIAVYILFCAIASIVATAMMPD